MKIRIFCAQRRTDAKSQISVLARKVLIVCCLLLLVGCQQQVKPEGVQVKVARVVSAQTLEVVGIGDQPSLISRVRLLGIDAPDVQQRPWGTKAKERLEAILSNNTTVLLEYDVEAKDKIGRSLAYIWKDGVLLNEKLVQEGHALFVPRSPNHKYDRRIEHAQEWARLMHEGIWDPDTPLRISPAEFRRQNR